MMDKDKFNRYCADVMRYESCTDNRIPFFRSRGVLIVAKKYYNPYEDLNQRIPVFDSLYDSMATITQRMEFNYNVNQHGIDKATKDFIISTMPEEK